jgi:hypothetical protein
LPDSYRPKAGLAVFFAVLFSLALVRVVLSFLAVPLAWIPLASIVLTLVFIATPVLALFFAAAHPWKPKLAVAFVVGGMAAQGIFTLLAARVLTGIPAAASAAVGQVGLIVWCVGLGALLATLLKDKNLLIPVSIFLVAFDIFLVVTPIGPTRMIMEAAPDVLPAVAWNLPEAPRTPTAGPVQPLAYIGPADFLFMGMFFIALFRFQMRTRQTLRWLIVALLLYVPLAFIFGAVPLLVPIGLAVLLVNLREFRMNKEELASTALVVLIALALIGWGMTRSAPPPEPLPAEGGQDAPVSEGSPPPAPEDPLL